MIDDGHAKRVSPSTQTNTPDPTAGPLAYRRSWLVSEHMAPALPEYWSSIPLGTQWRFSYHPTTPLFSSTDADTQVILVGHPVDLDAKTAEAAVIGERIMGQIRSDSSLGDDVVKYISYLSGRFVCLVVAADELTVLTDCAASYPVYWARSDASGLSLSTHARLCASHVGEDVDGAAVELMRRARELETPGTLFLPGTMTGYANVLQVLPNHLLRVRRDSACHERYYPFPDTEIEADSETAYRRFAESFSTNIRLLSSLGPVGVSLTGGRDSRATLAGLSTIGDPHLLTWTYFNSMNPHPAHLADLESARELALRLSIPHVDVDLGAAVSEPFGRALSESMGATAQMPKIPLAYHSQLPGDIVEFQSMAAEIGTGFYRRRSGSPSPERLSELYARGEYSRLPEVAEEMERFISYAGYAPRDIGSLDFHDLFYWEHRLGRWGSRRIQEVDLAHRLVLPFNSRTIVESLMAAPPERRFDKHDLIRFVGETAPVLV